MPAFIHHQNTSAEETSLSAESPPRTASGSLPTSSPTPARSIPKNAAPCHTASIPNSTSETAPSSTPNPAPPGPPARPEQSPPPNLSSSAAHPAATNTSSPFPYSARQLPASIPSPPAPPDTLPSRHQTPSPVLHSSPPPLFSPLPPLLTETPLPPSASLYSQTSSSVTHSLRRFSIPHPPYFSFRKCRNCAEMLAGGNFVFPANSASVTQVSYCAASRSTISTF